MPNIPTLGVVTPTRVRSRPLSHHRIAPCVGAITAVVIATTAWSQSVKKPAATTLPGEAVEFLPFVVSEAQDTGYVAQDTLSGTRTRTPLKYVAGAVGVFTRDFIDDLGATTEKDVLAYSASVVPEMGDQTANGRGNSLATPETFNYRIRGQAASRTRNFFDALIPPDTYNVGRFEVERHSHR